jgi:hypothetical protein
MWRIRVELQPDLIKLTEYGLYCEQGDFFIDPWQPVERAIITHVVDGFVEPMEIGHLPFKKKTYEDYLGKRGLKRLWNDLTRPGSDG